MGVHLLAKRMTALGKNEVRPAAPSTTIVSQGHGLPSLENTSTLLLRHSGLPFTHTSKHIIALKDVQTYHRPSHWPRPFRRCQPDPPPGRRCQHSHVSRLL